MLRQQTINLTDSQRRNAKLASIPSGLKQFAIKAIILFVLWRVIYEFWLGPSAYLDSRLIELVLAGSKLMLQPFYNNLQSTGYNILFDGKVSITIAAACNGLELMVLYAGFLLCLPIEWKKLLKYIILGFSLIIVLNMIRCAALAAMFHNHFVFADFMHHYLFKVAIYAVTFFLWTNYTKNSNVLKVSIKK